jgi:hypothetical protein
MYLYRRVEMRKSGMKCFVLSEDAGVFLEKTSIMEYVYQYVHNIGRGLNGEMVYVCDYIKYCDIYYRNIPFSIVFIKCMGNGKDEG